MLKNKTVPFLLALLFGALVVYLKFFNLESSFVKHKEGTELFLTLEKSCSHSDELMLMANAGLLKNYDPIVWECEQMKGVVKQLKVKFSTESFAQDIDSSFSRIEEELVTKTSNIESFKSNNSILKNCISSITVLSKSMEDNSPSKQLIEQVKLGELFALKVMMNNSEIATNELLFVVEQLKTELVQVKQNKDLLSQFVRQLQLVCDIQASQSETLNKVLGNGLDEEITQTQQLFNQNYEGKLRRADTIENIILVVILFGIGVIVFLIEALRKKRLALININENLEATVSSQTVELIKSVKELEQSNASLSKFTYAASHELKTPLRGISSLLSFIQEDMQGQLDEKSLENFEKIKERTIRMNNVVDGVLEYVKIDNEELSDELIDLSALIGEVIKNLKGTNEVEFLVSGDLPRLLAPRKRIYQIFESLLSNAVKFKKPDAAVIEVGCKMDDTRCVLWVKDNGIGIEPKYHGKVFELFQTIDTKNIVENTGVGLSIIKKVVEKLNGEIWAESEQDIGACFYMSFPVNIIASK